MKFEVHVLKEISWGRAFNYAIKYVLYILLWTIVGGILIAIGFTMVGVGFPYHPGGTPYHHPIGTVLAGLTLILIGYLIIILGAAASLFKLLSRLIVDTIGEIPGQSQQETKLQETMETTI
jgi:uncharacterized membrane protein